MEPDTDSTRAAPGGVFDSAKHLLTSVIAHLHSRLALLSTEFAEEKLRLTTLLYSALTALFFIFVTLILSLVFFIAIFWDTPYRLHAIGGLTLVFLIGSGMSWRCVRGQLHARPRLFEASLAELYKDRQQLEMQA